MCHFDNDFCKFRFMFHLFFFFPTLKILKFTHILGQDKMKPGQFVCSLKAGYCSPI